MAGTDRKVTTFGTEADEWLEQKQEVMHSCFEANANTVFVKVLPATDSSMPEPQTRSEQQSSTPHCQEIPIYGIDRYILRLPAQQVYSSPRIHSLITIR